MKGFGIEVKNNLLDPKHIERMDVAVWLYLFFLDKMTSISEEGIGKVLGGKPLKYEEDIRPELGISRRTYIRWIQILEKHGYVQAIRTPYGLSIRVYKAFKKFGKRSDRRDVPESVKRCATSGTSNKTLQRHNKIMKTPSEFSPSRKGGKNNHKRMDDVDYNIDPDSGEPITHNRWGKPLRSGPKEPKAEGKNKIALRVQRKFVELCQKKVGVSPIMDIKGYKIALFALNTGGLTEEKIYDLFDEWFGNGKPDEEICQITRALSTNQINGYKARNS